MKVRNLFLSVLILPLSALADPCKDIFSPLEREFLEHEHDRFGSLHELKLRDTEIILKLATEVAQAKGIAVKRITLKNRDQSEYPALQVLPGAESDIGRETARIERDFFGMALVFSPFDLARGMSAFFDPSGVKLGVPYRFFTSSIEGNASYLHELFHADDYRRLILGETPPWSGLMQVKEGSYLSPDNNDYYFRFSALNELPATSISILLNMRELSSSLASRDHAESLLGQIYHDAVSIREQAEQLMSLTERALLEMDQVQVRAATIRLGSRETQVSQTAFRVDSYNHEIINHRGEMVPVLDGSEFVLNWAKAPTTVALVARLNFLRLQAGKARAEALKLLEQIEVDIEFARLEGTNFNGVETHATQLHELLVNTAL